MGLISSRLTIAKTSSGELYKDFKSDKLLWRVRATNIIHECEVSSNELSTEEWIDWYNTLPDDEYPNYKVIDNCLIYCNCSKCRNVMLEDDIPDEYIENEIRTVYYNITDQKLVCDMVPIVLRKTTSKDFLRLKILIALLKLSKL
jgi:hypothetical protein